MRTSLRSTAFSKLDDCGKSLPSTRCSNLEVDKNEKVIQQNRSLEYAGLAHDAGNLLSALSLYSDLLALPGVLAEEYRAYADDIRILSDRSSSLIDRLVNHVHHLYDCSSEKLGVVLPEVVDRCQGLLGKIAGDRKIEICYGAGGFQPVCVPEEVIERILVNLLKNAAEATPKEGILSVKIEGRPNGQACHWDGYLPRVLMTVSDNGQGMNRETLLKLRQARFRSQAGRRGLGVPIVRELAVQSGGTFNIASRLGVGTHASIEWYAQSNGLPRGRSEILVA